MILQLQLPTASLIPKPNSKPHVSDGPPSFAQRCLPFSSDPLLSPTPCPATTPVVDAGLLFRQKLDFLEHHLGMDSRRALSLNPDLRSQPLPSLHALADVLWDYDLGDPSVAGRILSMHPSLLTSDPDKTILPVLRFLADEVGLPDPHGVRKAVISCPRLLASSVPDQLRPTLYFFRRIGFVGARRISCQTSLLLVSSVEDTLIPKLDYIQSLGFSYKETVHMVHRSPALFTYSIENNFRPKVEYLVRDMGRDVAELKGFPQYFSFSLERKIKPRHRLLVDHGFNSMSLSDMLTVSDGVKGENLHNSKSSHIANLSPASPSHNPERHKSSSQSAGINPSD